jgi:hypothetical protein
MLNVIRSCDNHMGNVMSNKETSGGPVNELKTYQTTLGCGMLFSILVNSLYGARPFAQ